MYVKESVIISLEGHAALCIFIFSKACGCTAAASQSCVSLWERAFSCNFCHWCRLRPCLVIGEVVSAGHQISLNTNFISSFPFHYAIIGTLCLERQQCISESSAVMRLNLAAANYIMINRISGQWKAST